MGLFRFSIDAALAEFLAEKLGLKAFVETGTYEGDSVSDVAPLFERLHTIELSEPLAAAAEARFADAGAVEVHRGRSQELLPGIVEELGDAPTLYWLDAHWSDERDAGGSDAQCPLLGELEAIGSLGPQSAILIDDARLFLTPPPEPADPEQWPTMAEVLDALGRLSDEHAIMVLDDVIAFFPKRIEGDLRAYARLNAADPLIALDQTRTVASHVEELRLGLTEHVGHLGGRIENLETRLREKLEELEARRARPGPLEEQLTKSRSELRALNLQAQGSRAALQDVRERLEIALPTGVSVRRIIDLVQGVSDAVSAQLEKHEQHLVELNARVGGAAEESRAAAGELSNQVEARSRETREAIDAVRSELAAVGGEVRELKGLPEEIEALREHVSIIVEREFVRIRRRQKLARITGIAALGRVLGRGGEDAPPGAIRRRWRSLRNRMRLQPKLGRLAHHPPMPLVIPDRYRNGSAPESGPSISIVTPSYNQSEFIGETIESVLGQNYPNLEYIVQDGGSDDGTRDILERNAGRLHHWESREDEGQAHAVNLGMQHASGEILGYLNSDDLLLPGALSYVGRYFARHPKVDVIYGHRVLIDEEGLEIGRWVLPRHSDSILAWADFIPQETLFWRRSAWEAVGGKLDESFQFALDWDLVLRFRDAGARIARVPRFLGAFRVHDSQKTNVSWDTDGTEEMAMIRRREHERDVQRVEIGEQLRWYLRRHVVLHKLYRAGVLRY